MTVPVIITHPELQGTAPSIWGSVESDAWARGCNWDQYIEWHKLCKCRGATLGKDHYDALRDLFNQIMEDEMK